MLGSLQRESLLAMMSGLLVWTLYFLFAYGFLSLGCALGLAEREWLGFNPVHLVILIATLLCLVAILYLAFRSWQQVRQLVPVQGTQEIQRRRYFMALVALSVHGLSVVALVWVAAPVLLRIPPCL